MDRFVFGLSHVRTTVNFMLKGILPHTSTIVMLQFGQRDLAKECLKLFFLRTPPANQFLCRAYLCEAQLLAPATANDPVSHGQYTYYM